MSALRFWPDTTSSMVLPAASALSGSVVLLEGLQIRVEWRLPPTFLADGWEIKKLSRDVTDDAEELAVRVREGGIGTSSSASSNHSMSLASLRVPSSPKAQPDIFQKLRNEAMRIVTK